MPHAHDTHHVFHLDGRSEGTPGFVGAGWYFWEDAITKGDWTEAGPVYTTKKLNGPHKTFADAADHFLKLVDWAYIKEVQLDEPEDIEWDDQPVPDEKIPGTEASTLLDEDVPF